MSIPPVTNPVLDGVSRSERRLLLAREATRRRTGDWGVWERLTFSRGSAGGGWAAEFIEAYSNGVFSVLRRVVDGGVVHLAISSLSGDRPGWREMQRIKNELASPEAAAVEVYPPQSEVVDEADMFHIWVLPERLPFGLVSRS